MNKRNAVIGGLALGLAAGGYWYAGRPVTVDIVTPRETSLQVTILATGQVLTRASTPINTEQAGTVRRLVDEGQRVEAGAVLAVVEDRDADSTVAQAQAGVASAMQKLARLREIDRPQAALAARQATILLQQAERQLRKLAPLADQQLVAPETLDSARETVQLRSAEAQAAALRVQALAAQGRDEQLAEAALQQARAQLAQARTRQQRQTLTSPFAATVLERKADIGQYLKAGDTLLTLAPPGQQEILARLDERWLPQLSVGQPATLVADAFPRRPFPARVAHIAPLVNDTRGTVEVRLDSPQWPGFLREGMTVSVELLSRQQAKALVIPAVALQQTGDQYWLWLVRKGKALRQNVGIGQRSGEQVQVLGGVDGQSQVIVSTEPLRPGQAVSIHRKGD